MEMAMWFLCGIGCGGVITWLICYLRRPKRIGNLRVDRSDPNEQPLIFLELEPFGIPYMNEHDTAEVAIINQNYIPRN